MRVTPWFQRTWSFQLPAGAFAAVLERLRGTPVRAAAMSEDTTDRALSHRPGGAWSAKDHIGHLDDLHDLDMTRVREFLSRAPTLSAADPGNRVTYQREHWSRDSAQILSEFRKRRQELVGLLETVSEEDILVRSIHPRLKLPIRLIDWAEFVADHDDHHLAAARAALRSYPA